jgi:hypothetical protein
MYSGDFWKLLKICPRVISTEGKEAGVFIICCCVVVWGLLLGH